MISKAQKLIQLGEAVAIHGLAGEVKVHVVADSPDFAVQFKRLVCGKAEYRVQRSRIHKNCAIVKFEGVDSPDTARLLVGNPVHFHRADAQLEQGSFFIADILGFKVIDATTGKNYGTLQHVDNHGAGAVYYIKSQDGKEHLFPAVGPFVKKHDFENEQILIEPIPGMFEDE